MRPSFNTAGPCFPDEHYMLPPERRLGRIMELIDDGKYFTLHAGRQTGKTTSAQWLTEHYNAGTRYSAVWFDLQAARDQPDLARAFATVLSTLDLGVEEMLPGVGAPSGRERFLDVPETALIRYLQDLAARSPRPLVVLFDGTDCLVGAAVVSFLAQLRHGHLARRKAPFPHSIVLIGQHDLGSGSPFNITAETTPFSEPDVAELLAQHTTATGQRFEPEASARIHDLSQGHPWLVSALADQIVDRDVPDRSVAVTVAHADAAKETIILERRTHLDSLIHELHGPRVRGILAPLLVGDLLPPNADDDVAYVLDLGILRIVRGQLAIANPIYRELIPRALTWVDQTASTR